MIYKEMKPFFPNITQDNLRKKTLRARELLGKMELELIKLS